MVALTNSSATVPLKQEGKLAHGKCRCHTHPVIQHPEMDEHFVPIQNFMHYDLTVARTQSGCDTGALTLLACSLRRPHAGPCDRSLKVSFFPVELNQKAVCSQILLASSYPP